MNKTIETGQEIDQLLADAVKRQESLRMPKVKPSWQKRKRSRLERSRKHEGLDSVREYRQRYRSSLRGQWIKLRHQMLRVGEEWDLSYEDWVWMWTNAQPASNGRPAWTARGRDGKKDVMVLRLNPKKAFTINNIVIAQAGKVLWRA